MNDGSAFSENAEWHNLKRQRNLFNRILIFLYLFRGYAMEIVSVANGYEDIFWSYVSRDPINYYFFILDWTQHREQTKILLAVEGDRVLGSLLIFADYIVQLRETEKLLKNCLIMLLSRKLIYKRR